jgi:multidrug resistance efflux pump
VTLPVRIDPDDVTIVDAVPRFDRSLEQVESEVGALSPLFRQRAVAAYMRDEHDGVLVGIAPRWGYRVLVALIAMHAAALALSVLTRVDLTTRGQGVVRAPGDLQIVTAKISGPVAQVKARSGDTVSQGDVLVTIDSGALDTSIAEADKKIRLLTDRLEGFDATQKKLFAERLALLGRRASLLRMRAGSHRQSAARLRRKVQAFDELEDTGYVAPVRTDEVREELAQSARQRMSLEEDLSRTLAEIASVRQEREHERTTLEQQVRDAQDKRDALTFSLHEKDVPAPRAGYLEALLVKPGDYVQAGAPIAKVVRSTAPTQIVAFVAERDRAFLKEGAQVRVEVDQLPASEFGALTGYVSRIASDLASPYEIADAFGEKAELHGASYRIEIAIDERAKATPLYARVRSGSLVSVRFVLRSVPMIALAFEPLRRWMQP